MAKKYAIIDIETTGGLVKRDRITEIAIVLHDGTKILDKYQTLINPERSIPEFISRLTGITSEMVADAPKFYEVAKEIVERTEGAIFVAHNARFDYSFIRHEFERFGYTYTRRQLCTARLAKKVFPELRRHGLDSLINHLGICCENRHRAMDDTLATAQVFEEMMRRDTQEENLNDIVNLGIKESRLPINITLERLHALPEATGIYYFHDIFGDIVYVGKSINIRKRVMQHFAKMTNKAAKMQKYVHDISFRITGSELAALLLENNEIKKHQPALNRAQRKNAYPYVIYACSDDHGYLRLAVAKENRVTDPESEIIHEYTSKSAAKGQLRGLIQEFGLCLNKTDQATGPGACFNYKIGQCFGACLDQEDTEEYNDRVLEAISHVKHSIAGSALIIDKGREPGERTIIAVEDGCYRGFGYLEQGVPLNNLSEAFDHIDIYKQTPESTRIIHSFMMSKKVEHIVRF